MKERIIGVLTCFVLFIVIVTLFNMVQYNTILNSNSNSKLVIFGDNIDEKYVPILEDDNIYISFDTLSNFIDEDIYFDEETQKVIITNKDYVYKFDLKNNQVTRNFEEYDIGTCAKYINDEVYINISLLKDIYNIKTEYNEELNTISIDRKDLNDINLNYNGVKLYSDIDTSSKVLETLNKDNTVFVYEDSLNHNRWYKVKSDSGKIGYVDKSSVTLLDDTLDNNQEEQENEKLIMFWQYGSSLETLGDKIEGVNVVMPTWYSISDANGNVEDEYSKDYYERAKSYGYQIWPIITNGFDKEDFDKKEATSQIMNDEQKRETLIKNIVKVIKDNKLDGINIDFEGMKEEDKYMYTQFLRELYPMVREIGAKLSVDIYFTNYIDRQGVGKACDYVMLMGYDQRGNWSDEAGSISEIDWVEENVNSLIEDSNIPSSKIILGVPFYTRLWEIDASGDISTTVCSMQGSQEFIQEHGLEVQVDEQSGQHYVELREDDKTYKLWIEDAYSIAKRADTVLNYNLAGITAWQKGFETSDIWQVLYEKLK